MGIIRNLYTKASAFFLVTLLLSLLPLSQNALAYTVTTTGNGGTYSGYGPYQTGRGGEFTLIAGDGLGFVLSSYGANSKNVVSNGTFQSFCLEENEYISGNTTYSATLNNGAVNGGNGAINNKDRISQGTAWLYSQFAKGSLENYKYDAANRSSSAADLQNTIWWLEGEQATLADGNVFKILVLSKFKNETAAKTDSNGDYGVMALNLKDSQGGYHQDMLVATPVPAAIWLLCSGLIGLAGLRKRINVC